MVWFGRRRREPFDPTSGLPGPIISGEPFRDDTSVATDSDHAADELVEAHRAETRFEADVLVASLGARGIHATALHGVRGGGPHQVVVLAHDAAAAREWLEAESD